MDERTSSCSSTAVSGRQSLIEIALIVAVFFIQGAWPVPDVNEPYYLGKVIHFWNHGWLRRDFFMDSADAHQVFDLSFGWLSLFLPQVPLAWTGRIVTWLLLAWAWRRLSFAVVPRAWWSVLTAALFVGLMDRCQMAGEWVVGGVEAKGIAYVFVFLGLESLVRNRWNRALLLFGAGAAFHVLVGGWAARGGGHRLGQWSVVSGQWPVGARRTNAAVALALARGFWVACCSRCRGWFPRCCSIGAPTPRTVRQAHQIDVFQRLPHHLVLSGIRPDFILRMGLLFGFWLLLSRFSHGASIDGSALPDGRVWPRQSPAVSRLRAFVLGAVAITLAGVAIQPLVWFDRPLAAELLRYYWFRLTNVALPLGVALEGIAILVGRRAAGAGANGESSNRRGPKANSRELTAPGIARCGLLLAVLASAAYLGVRAWDRIFPGPPRSHRLDDFDAWHQACQWVAHSGKVPADARFLVPRLSQTFSWYTGRGNMVDWKDVPQDARELVVWWQRIQDVFATGRPPPEHWYKSLAELGEKRLRQSARSTMPNT